MSVRSEPTTVPTAAMAAIDVNAPVPTASNEHVAATISAAQSADSSLGDANTLSTSHPDHPLRRSFVTSIRATLGDLCLRKAKGTWAPSSEALRSMLQQKKFVDLGGSAEMSGDLKSIVLHNMTLASVKSDFDVPIGMKITGVDNSTFSLTGEAYSAIVPPKHESTTARRLQEDDVALAYEFSRKVIASPLQTKMIDLMLPVRSPDVCIVFFDVRSSQAVSASLSWTPP